MQHKLIATLIGVLLLGACKAATNESKKKTETQSCATEGRCGACVSDLKGWLEKLDAEGGDSVSTQRGLSLPLLSPDVPTTRLPRRPIIVATVDAITFEGVQAADPTAVEALPPGEWMLPELHARLRRQREESCSGEPFEGMLEVTIQMDRRVSWRILRDIAATADAAGFERLYLAVDRKSALPPPGPSNMATQIEKTERDIREGRTDLTGTPDTRAAQALTASCPQLASALLPPADLEGRARERFHVSAWPTAIESCGCKLDIEGLKALVWSLTDRTLREGLYTSSVPVDLVNGKSPTRIEHAASATWDSVSKDLTFLEGESYYFALTGIESTPPPPKRSGDACREL